MGVDDLRVKLDTVDPARWFLEGRDRCITSRRGAPEALRRGADRVGMAHPDVEAGWDLAENDRRRSSRRGQRQFGPPVFSSSGPGNGAAQLLRDKLGAVADPKHRNDG